MAERLAHAEHAGNRVAYPVGNSQPGFGPPGCAAVADI